MVGRAAGARGWFGAGARHDHGQEVPIAGCAMRRRQGPARRSPWARRAFQCRRRARLFGGGQMRCRLRRPGGWRAASAGSDGQLVRSTAGRPAIFRCRPALALAALPATATVAVVRRQAHLPWRWRTIVVGVAFGARVRTHPGQYWQTPPRRQSHFFACHVPQACRMPECRCFNRERRPTAKLGI